MSQLILHLMAQNISKETNSWEFWNLGRVWRCSIYQYDVNKVFEAFCFDCLVNSYIKSWKIFFSSKFYVLLYFFRTNKTTRSNWKSILQARVKISIKLYVASPERRWHLSLRGFYKEKSIYKGGQYSLSRSFEFSLPMILMPGLARVSICAFIKHEYRARVPTVRLWDYGNLNLSILRDWRWWGGGGNWEEEWYLTI